MVSYFTGYVPKDFIVKISKVLYIIKLAKTLKNDLDQSHFYKVHSLHILYEQG